MFFILRAEDLSNGDARFSMVENGQIISCSYVNRSEESIIYTQYENGTEVFSETKAFQHMITDPSTQSHMEGSASLHAAVPVDPIGGGSSYVTVGKVGYNHYVQGMVMCTNYITWAYHTHISPVSTCDLNGYYRDLVDFAASVLGGLGLLTTSGALQVANTILGILGITGSVGAFFIPPNRVESVETRVIWRATVGRSVQYYDGSRHVVTHANGQTQTVTEGDYYPITAIANHNYSLALAPYMYFFPGSDNREVISWP